MRALTAMLRSAVLVFGLLVGALFPAAGAHSAEPDLALAARLPENLSFCGERVAQDHPAVRELFEKEMLLTLGDRPQVILWLKRAPRYLPEIADELKRRGMPEDLKYLVVTESGLRPHVGSPKGALGFWQLMPETARRYGLRVDRYIDERRDLGRSTPAALRYLRELRERLGSWLLAAAAFNMGEEGLIAEMIEQNTRNYLDLYLSLETQRYLFRILVAKRILEDPAGYGFDLRREDLYAPPAYRTVALDFSVETPISLLARLSGTTFKAIKELNPHLRGHYIQPGRHEIRLPPAVPEDLQAGLDVQLAAYLSERRQRVYVVQSGDNLSSIAERHNVPLAALLIWNRIDTTRVIHPGDRLVIYPRSLNDIDP